MPNRLQRVPVSNEDLDVRLRRVEQALFDETGKSRLDEILSILHALGWAAKVVTWIAPVVATAVTLLSYYLGKK